MHVLCQIAKGEYKFFELESKFVRHFMLMCHNCMEFNNGCVCFSVVHRSIDCTHAHACVLWTLDDLHL